MSRDKTDDERILENVRDMARQIQGDMGGILTKLDDGDYAGATADHRELNEVWHQLGCDLDWLRQVNPATQEDLRQTYGLPRRP